MRTLFIKNMVCDRCILVVKQVLDTLGWNVQCVKLGEITTVNELTEADKLHFKSMIEPLGFQLIDDKKSRIIEQVKKAIIELIHRQDEALKVNLSDYLTEIVHMDYPYLSNLFSEVEGTTIEKYHIAQKIERVKELLVYDELSLSEIAFKMNYSSVAYLSNQFKKTTGLTPKHYKEIGNNKRNALDKV